MTNSPSFKKRAVGYKPSIVTYLDILGFRRLVAERTAGQISRILRLVKMTVAPGKEVSKVLGFRVQHFSDLAVRVLPIVAPGGDVFSELLSLIHIQMSLLEQDILVRGAITFGNIEKSWGLLYGPGLIRAYELEQKAVYPRVIVDPAIFPYLRTNAMLRHPDHSYKTEMSYIRKLIRIDSDGYYFVDYLRAIESEFDEPEIGYPHFLKLHRNHIATGLRKFRSDTRVLQKYKWLKAYHNATLQGRFRGPAAATYVL